MSTIIKVVTLLALMSVAMGAMTGALSNDNSQWKFTPTDAAAQENAVVPATMTAGGCPESTTDSNKVSACTITVPTTCGTYSILLGNNSASGGQVGMYMDPTPVCTMTKFILQAGVTITMLGSYATPSGSTAQAKWWIVGGSSTQQTRIIYGNTFVNNDVITTYGTNNVIGATLASIQLGRRRDVEEDEMAMTYGFITVKKNIGVGAGPGAAKREVEEAAKSTGSVTAPVPAPAPDPNAPASNPIDFVTLAAGGVAQILVYGSFEFTALPTDIFPGSSVSGNNHVHSNVKGINPNTDIFKPSKCTVGSVSGSGFSAGTLTFEQQLTLNGFGDPCFQSSGGTVCAVAICVYQDASGPV